MKGSVSPTCLDPVWRKTLKQKKSLTSKLHLIQTASTPFFLYLLHERWALTPPIYRQHIPCRRSMQRVIEMGLGEDTYIQACSYIPTKTWLHNKALLQKLGNQSLGQLLFSHPQSYRKDMWFGYNSDKRPLRVSLFFLYSKPLVVEECFVRKID